MFEAILDAGGHLISFERCKASTYSIHAALEKAKTACYFQMPSSEVEEKYESLSTYDTTPGNIKVSVSPKNFWTM